jgi:hypothetical protein
MFTSKNLIIVLSVNQKKGPAKPVPDFMREKYYQTNLKEILNGEKILERAKYCHFREPKS